jgi:bifunctional non-homologous end joining protein LigD
VSPRATEVEFAGRQLRLSNLDKVLFPAAGFTKGEVIGYYQAIAETMLPHVTGRPMTLKRYPNGVDSGFFYEKNCPKHRPDWLPTVAVDAPSAKRTVHFCLLEEPAALVWTANLASLELHVSLSRADDLDTPTAIVFDLDPGPPADVVDCCRVALWIRELLGSQGLETIIKTSGSKGLQLYAPLNTPADYGHTKGIARAVAQVLEAKEPKHVLSRMSRDLREGKVFVDWSQNDSAKTTVAVYSLRARERPTVSTPLLWSEVEACLDAGDASQLVFETADVLARVAEHGDLFAPLETLQQEMPALGTGR